MTAGFLVLGSTAPDILSITTSSGRFAILITPPIFFG